MQIIGLKSRLIKPNTDLINTIWQVLQINKIKPKNGDILVISSKIVALCQGRVRKVGAERAFLKLIQEEADVFLGGKVPLTLKDNILIPQAGIDRSNMPNGFAVLWPKNAWGMARDLWRKIRKKWRLKNFGVVISDSRCAPLRWGTTGLALAWHGFLGVEDIRGKKDLFKKPLKVTKKAVADNVVSAALMVMGEAAEKMPFVLIQNASVKFTNRIQKKSEIFIKPKDCLFAPIYKKF